MILEHLNITPALQIEGWMDAPELLWLASIAAQSLRSVEIGSWRGRSARAMLDSTGGTLFAVDTWKGSRNEKDLAHLKDIDSEIIYNDFLANMKSSKNYERLVPYRMDSLEAAAHFAGQGIKFDFIFIDAGHTYEEIMADLQAWTPLVRAGGVLAGHDYTYQWPGVVEAVNKCFPDHMMGATTIWAVRQGEAT